MNFASFPGLLEERFLEFDSGRWRLRLDCYAMKGNRLEKRKPSALVFNTSSVGHYRTRGCHWYSTGVWTRQLEGCPARSLQAERNDVALKFDTPNEPRQPAG